MKKILIIEDDPIVAKIYASRLEKENFQVHVAEDGQRGFYSVGEFKPDAVLLDLMLPKMNGLEILKKIRAIKNSDALPVFVFTNAYVTSMIADAMTAGATAVYNKASVTPRQLVDVLNAIFVGSNANTPAPGNAAISQPGEFNRFIESAASAKSDEAAFQAELQRSFAMSGRVWISEMRRSLQEVRKSTDEAGCIPHLEKLFSKLSTHGGSAAAAGNVCISKLSAATEALVRELHAKPGTIAPSTLRTTAQALDCLDDLSQSMLPPDLLDNPPVQILVADDEILSRRAVVTALEKGSLKAVAVENASLALDRAAHTKFDLILLDINMPGMSGFDLCEKLRQGGLNKTTPVVFVTSSSDFQARTQSTLRGGTDLIAKPFMFIELTVHALTHTLRSRSRAMRNGTMARSATPSPAMASATA